MSGIRRLLYTVVPVSRGCLKAQKFHLNSNALSSDTGFERRNGEGRKRLRRPLGKIRSNTHGPGLSIRLPARRWKGVFSVRAMIQIGDKKLNGQFLLDTGIDRNLLSPEWLLSQGISLSDLAQREGELDEFKWHEKTVLSKEVKIDEFEASGLRIDDLQFWQAKTKLFSPPRSFSECCDGVLGREFFRKFAVKFVHNAPFRVELWERQNFNPKKDWKWVEVASSRQDKLMSTCQMKVNKKDYLTGVFWETLQTDPLQVTARSMPGLKKTSIRCSNRLIGNDLPFTFHSNQKRSYHSASVGIPVLGRGDFFLDLAHGRIWFRESDLKKSILKDKAGFSLDFREGYLGRELYVTNVDKDSPAWKLLPEGMVIGAIITEIDGKRTDEMDIWEVRQIFCGEKGNRVKIRWKGAEGWKISEIKLRP